MCLECDNSYIKSKHRFILHPISFLNDIARIERIDYQATDQDILHVRAPTTNIVEYPFNLDGFLIRYLFEI